jgi:hypothetical protein
MKPNELRIGNYVYAFKTIWQIDNTYFCNLEQIETYNFIPLTEEWLLKFGFEKVEDINKDTYPDYKIKGMLIHSNVHGNYVLGNYSPICFIKYVHQLQNLYFALTGEELEIKE